MKNIGTKMKTLESNSLEMLPFPGLGRSGDIAYFVTTRHGGVSDGPYRSMNLGLHSGDAPARVLQNREILAARLGVSSDRLITPRQIHGDGIAQLDEAYFSHDEETRAEQLSEADALITDKPGIYVAVSTADCVPVLLYAPDRKVVAAVHAGWRGTVKGIAAKTVRRMVEAYECDPSQIRAGIGPSIGPEAFEVGEEVIDAFRAAGADLSQVATRHPQTGKAHVNLWEANRLQLLEAGLSAPHIEVAGICTFTHSGQFFSARRLGVQCGRMWSGICLDEFKK